MDKTVMVNVVGNNKFMNWERMLGWTKLHHSSNRSFFSSKLGFTISKYIISSFKPLNFWSATEITTIKRNISII
jgi:hypothetical protein